MFELNGIRHRYDASTEIRVGAWTAAQGDAWLLAGPSGSGKTTVLHWLAGLLRPTAGEIVVGGMKLGALAPSALDRWRGGAIGFVPQRLHLIDDLTVLDNVVLAQFLAGHPQDPIAARSLLERLHVSAHAGKTPDALSQGQAQRVALARALINRPRLILADEPTANLDDAAAERALDLLLEEAAAIGATLVVASHDARVRCR